MASQMWDCLFCLSVHVCVSVWSHISEQFRWKQTSGCEKIVFFFCFEDERPLTASGSHPGECHNRRARSSACHLWWPSGHFGGCTQICYRCLQTVCRPSPCRAWPWGIVAAAAPSTCEPLEKQKAEWALSTFQTRRRRSAFMNDVPIQGCNLEPFFE